MDINSMENKMLELEQNITTLTNSIIEYGKQLVVFGSDNIILKRNLQVMINRNNNMKYELFDSLGRGDLFFNPIFRSNEETLNLIIDKGMSLGRFGDGEFSIAFDIDRQKFQKLNEKLKTRIWEVLNTPNDSFLIAIAKNYGDLSVYTEAAADGIRQYMTDEIRFGHQKILPNGVVFSDAYMTRPYVMYRDNDTDAPKERFHALKRIWSDRDVIMVEGAETRLGVRNNLFDNAESIRRILAPATNSYDRYDELYDACLKYGNSDTLFILAIGPSSGVLAFDLCKNGFQAVDVGHIDMEYEWFLAGKGKRVEIPAKRSRTARKSVKGC